MLTLLTRGTLRARWWCAHDGAPFGVPSPEPRARGWATKRAIEPAQPVALVKEKNPRLQRRARVSFARVGAISSASRPRTRLFGAAAGGHRSRGDAACACELPSQKPLLRRCSSRTRRAKDLSVDGAWRRRASDRPPPRSSPSRSRRRLRRQLRLPTTALACRRPRTLATRAPWRCVWRGVRPQKLHLRGRTIRQDVSARACIDACALLGEGARGARASTMSLVLDVDGPDARGRSWTTSMRTAIDYGLSLTMDFGKSCALTVGATAEIPTSDYPRPPPRPSPPWSSAASADAPVDGTACILLGSTSALARSSALAWQPRRRVTSLCGAALAVEFGQARASAASAGGERRGRRSSSRVLLPVVGGPRFRQRAAPKAAPRDHRRGASIFGIGLEFRVARVLVVVARGRPPSAGLRARPVPVESIATGYASSSARGGLGPARGLSANRRAARRRGRANAALPICWRRILPAEPARRFVPRVYGALDASRWARDCRRALPCRRPICGAGLLSPVSPATARWPRGGGDQPPPRARRVLAACRRGRRASRVHRPSFTRARLRSPRLKTSASRNRRRHRPRPRPGVAACSSPGALRRPARRPGPAPRFGSAWTLRLLPLRARRRAARDARRISDPLVFGRRARVVRGGPRSWGPRACSSRTPRELREPPPPPGLELLARRVLRRRRDRRAIGAADAMHRRPRRRLEERTSHHDAVAVDRGPRVVPAVRRRAWARHPLRTAGSRAGHGAAFRRGVRGRTRPRVRCSGASRARVRLQTRRRRLRDEARLRARDAGGVAGRDGLGRRSRSEARFMLTNLCANDTPRDRTATGVCFPGLDESARTLVLRCAFVPTARPASSRTAARRVPRPLLCPCQLASDSDQRTPSPEVRGEVTRVQRLDEAARAALPDLVEESVSDVPSATRPCYRRPLAQRSSPSLSPFVGVAGCARALGHRVEPPHPCGLRLLRLLPSRPNTASPP